MANNLITVFEHSTLHFDEKEFREYHFNALVKFNDIHGSKYFVPGYQKITFKSYVGVIQVGDKVIEILPKADKLSENDEKTRNKWQGALLYMLRKLGYIRLNETEQASQKLRNINLLDIYLYSFLTEVERLVHAGLVKKYYKIRSNKTALKGRLLIEKQIQLNSIHKERFFTEYSIYDCNNIFNSVLKRALCIIQLTNTNSYIKNTASRLLLNFENIESWNGDINILDKLVFDRKTKSYKYPIDLAKMIILNFCPDMSAGNKPILAILFDMNKLFEKFIYRMLKKEEAKFTPQKLSISQQNSHLFWKWKTIRPDIIMNFEREEGGQKYSFKVIVDTKWKIIDSNNPSDNDLKQMYTYNFQFGSQKSILFYPSIGQKNEGASKYENSKHFKDFSHSCELYFADLFVGDVMDDGFGIKFLNHIINSHLEVKS